MPEQFRSPRNSSSLSLPLVTGPPLCGNALAPMAGHSPEEIIDTVFRVLCGYESISEVCLRKGIKASLYYRWRENFVEICREWSRRQFKPSQTGKPTLTPKPTSISDVPAATLGFGPILDPLDDIVRRAQDRLSIAWRADYQSLRMLGK